MNGNKIKLEVKFVIIVVLFCTYILPIAELSQPGDYRLPKLIFIACIVLLYVLSLKRLTKKEVVFNYIVVSLIILTQNINYSMFFTLMYIIKFIDNKEEIVSYIKNSNILYICLGFSIFYTYLYFGYQGRYAFTAIKEINQSGLAIFCLAIMFMKKNKKIAYCILIWGLTTLSRSYYLAIIVYFMFENNIFKRLLSKRNIEILNYTNITIVSSVILIILGFFYIEQYKLGNIDYVGTSTSRLINFIDLSNYCRFSSIAFLVLVYKKNWLKIFTGITDREFNEIGRMIARDMNVLHRYTIPHNLFFSHLKIYGVFAFVEIIYVSNILKNIVDKNNFGLYIGLVLYSIFLGAGLYSYWLYLSIFVLIIKSYDDNNLITKIEMEEKGLIKV